MSVLAPLLTDLFQRANSTGLGANYSGVTSQGSMNVSSDTAVPNSLSGDCGAYWSAFASPADQFAQVTIGSVGTGALNSGTGILLRVSSVAETFYRIAGTGGHIAIEKCIATTFTALGNAGATGVTTGSVLLATIIGNVLNVYLDNTLVIGPITDSSIASGSFGLGYSSTDSASSILAFTAGAVLSNSWPSYQRPHPRTILRM